MRLEDACIVFTDGDWIESKDQSECGIRLVQTGNIGEGCFLEKEGREKYISEDTFSRLNCTEIYPGDILISRLPDPVGRGCIIPEKKERMITAVDCTICRVREDLLNKRYFCYFLRSPSYYNQLEQSVTGTTRKRISRKNLGNVEISVPDRTQQLFVISVFDKLTAMITHREQEIQKLDNLIKARFVEMFDLEKSEWGTFGRDTDFVDYRGHTPELSNSGTIRMVNAKSVGKGYFKYIDEFVTEEVYNSWMHRGFGYPGDVLFVTEGHTFGNTCLIPDDLTKFALGQRVITIKGHSDKLNNSFLCAYMQMDRFWRDINVYRTGGTAQGIRSKNLIKVKLPIPPIKLQRQFADFVTQIHKSKVTIQKSLDETQALFNSLMQKYFS